VRTATVPGDRLFTPFDLLPQDEVLRLHDFGDRRIDLRFDGVILSLEIEKRYPHSLIVGQISCSVAHMPPQLAIPE
jgi:hypothetical protein